MGLGTWAFVIMKFVVFVNSVSFFNSHRKGVFLRLGILNSCEVITNLRGVLHTFRSNRRATQIGIGWYGAFFCFLSICMRVRPPQIVYITGLGNKFVKRDWVSSIYRLILITMITESFLQNPRYKLVTQNNSDQRYLRGFLKKRSEVDSTRVTVIPGGAFEIYGMGMKLL